MIHSLVIIQSLLMLLLPSRAPAPGSWSNAHFELSSSWTMGESRWLAHTSEEKLFGSSSGFGGPIMSWSIKCDLSSLDAMAGRSFADSFNPTAMPAGAELNDRFGALVPQDSPAPAASPTSPLLASDPYTATARMYYLPANLSSLSGDFGAQNALRESIGNGTVLTPIGGGLGGGGVTPPDLGGSNGGLGSGVSATPEPSGAALALIGLSIACHRRRRRH